MNKYINTLTYKDISEIPILLERFNLPENLNKISKYREVFLLGRGSSGNATLFAKYIWEIYCGIISNIVHPFSIFNTKKKMNFSNKVLFSFSQSGKSYDIVKCSKIIKKMGGKIVAITNESKIKNNDLAKMSDIHILLSNSKEVPVAATKSFILQLWCILKLAKFFGANFKESIFKKTIEEINYLINNFEKIYNKTGFDLILESFIVGFVGRGPFNAVAEDSALKFREMAMTHSLGYSAAEFLHGPIGAYTKKDLVVILSRDKKLTEDLLLVKNKLDERGIKYIILTPFSENYPFNALSMDVFIKLCALKIAVTKGLNPDNPKGLKKVTYTI
ncbi:MAG: SIS domain-containing protein [Elusimicrobiota bacterium]